MAEWGHGTFKIHFVIIKSYMYLDEKKIKLFYKASNDKQQSPTYPSITNPHFHWTFNSFISSDIYPHFSK